MISLITYEFPISVVILSYVAVGLLAVILLLLFRISSQLTTVANRLKRSTRSESKSSSATASSSETESEPSIVEVGPGTPFEEFLNEDPENRRLSKKEQFKAYRKWRAEKGLNWSK